MAGDQRVCVVGDSFVAGVGDPQHLGWVGRLAARTHHAGRKVTADNLGVRRETSAQVLDRWERECAPRLPDGCDARVVASFGVNDAVREEGRRRVGLDASAANLTSLLVRARSRSWPVLVVGPPPTADAGLNERTAELDERFQQMCAASAVPYVSVVGVLLGSAVWMAQTAAGDGAHPGGEGELSCCGGCVLVDGSGRLRAWSGEWRDGGSRTCQAAARPTSQGRQLAGTKRRRCPGRDRQVRLQHCPGLDVVAREGALPRVGAPGHGGWRPQGGPRQRVGGSGQLPEGARQRPGKNFGMTTDVYVLGIHFPATGECLYYDAKRVKDAPPE